MAGLVVLGLIGIGVAAVFVGRAVDETLEEEGFDGGIEGLLGGDCLEFQTSFIFLMGSSMFTAGADEAQQEQIQDDLQELEDLAPDEIQDDVVIVTDAFRESMEIAFESGGMVGGEVDPDEMEEAEAILESPEVVEAQENIDDWLTENCGGG